MKFHRLAVGNDAPAWFSSTNGGFARWDQAPYLPGAKLDGMVLATLADANILAPAAPTKVLCVGRNYAAHAKELGHEVPTEPLLFLKPSSSIIGPGAAVIVPAASARVEHEAELAVVIGKRMTRVAEDVALSHVFGYTCGLDMTARDLQRKDVQFTRAKGFDTFCPLGPHIETELDPRDLSISCHVNGELRQNGRTAQMTFSVARLLSFMSHVMTLEPGDVILTGTPEGVGPVVAGDNLSMQITGIGELHVHVAAALAVAT